MGQDYKGVDTLKTSYKCELVYKKEIADGIFDFRIKSAEIAKNAKCGQFLHINCGNGTLLRRPISICDVLDDNIVRFIFEKRGQGTEELSKFKANDFIDVLGPLGHGFTIDSEKYKNPVVIGGGIGIFPLYNLTKNLKNPTVFLGFRNKDRVVLEDEFSAVSKTTVATDDGSYGYNGFAVELLKEHIKNQPTDIIYSCGPLPMLKAIKTIAENAGILCEMSLEQRMGCGIGACLVCSCETNNTGSEKYAKVCTNGPVFYSEEVTLND